MGGRAVDTGRSHTSFYLHSLFSLVMWRISIGPSLAQLVVFAQQAAFALRACQPQASSLHRSRAGLRDPGDVLAPKRNLIVPGW